jgi:Cysteine-rich CPCC
MTNTYPCPCCGNLTLDEEPPGTFLICPVCYWEDDNVQYREPRRGGGANDVSLEQAQENYRRVGASEARFLGKVRPPRPDEVPDA